MIVGNRNDEQFYSKTELPANAYDVLAYLENRLQQALDYFSSQEKDNTFASIDDGGWALSKDPAEELTNSKLQGIEQIEPMVG